MAVCVQVDSDSGMPKALRDYLGVDALGKHEAGMGVPGIMEPDSSQPQAVDQLLPCMAHSIGEHWPAIRPGKDKVILF